MGKTIAKKPSFGGLTSLAVTPPAAKVDLAKYRNDAADFLLSFQLFSSSKEVKKKLIGPGNYGIVVDREKEKLIDLGETCDILPLASRHKALDYGVSPPVVCYDPNDPVYQDIEERSKEKGSNCLHGPSVLLLERKTGKLYEWFMINKTSRAEAEKIIPFLPIFVAEAEEFGVDVKDPEPITLTSRFAEKGDMSWYAPVVNKCSTPFTELPDPEYLVAQINKFNNPPKKEVEVDEGGRAV